MESPGVPEEERTVILGKRAGTAALLAWLLGLASVGAGVPPPAKAAGAAAEEGGGEGTEEPEAPEPPKEPPRSGVYGILDRAEGTKDPKQKETLLDQARDEAVKAASASGTAEQRLDALADAIPSLCRVAEAYLNLAEDHPDYPGRAGVESKGAELAKRARSSVVEGRKAMDEEKKNLEAGLEKSRADALEELKKIDLTATTPEQRFENAKAIDKKIEGEWTKINHRIESLQLYEDGKDDFGFGYFEAKAHYLEGRTANPDEAGPILDKAYELALSFVERYKDSNAYADGKFLVAEIHEAAGEYDDALQAYHEILTGLKIPRDVPREAVPAVRAHFDSLGRRAVWRKLEILKATGRYRDALKWMEEMPARLGMGKDDPARVDLDFDRFKMFMDIGADREARALAERYRPTKEGKDGPDYAKITALVRAGKAKEAEALADPFKRPNGGNPRWYPFFYNALLEHYGEEAIRGLTGFWNDAEAAKGRKEYLKAIGLYERYLRVLKERRSKENEETAWWAVGFCYYKLERWYEAGFVFLRYARQYPKDPKAAEASKFALGFLQKMAVQQKPMDPADRVVYGKVLKEYLEKFPDEPKKDELYYQLADIEREGGDPKAAADHYRMIPPSSRFYEPALINLAWAALGQYQELKKDPSKAAEAKASFESSSKLLGSLMARIEASPSADPKERARQQKTLGKAVYSLASLYMGAKEYEKALPLLKGLPERFSEFKEKKTEVLFWQYVCHKGRGDLDACEKTAKELFQADPKFDQREAMEQNIGALHWERFEKARKDPKKGAEARAAFDRALGYLLPKLLKDAGQDPGQRFRLLLGYAGSAKDAAFEAKEVEFLDQALAEAAQVKGTPYVDFPEHRKSAEIRRRELAIKRGEDELALKLTQTLLKYPEPDLKYSLPLLKFIPEYYERKGTLKDLDKALEGWRDLLRRSPEPTPAKPSPNWWDAKYHVVEVHVRLKDHEMALSVLGQALLFRPDLGGPETKAKFKALLDRVAKEATDETQKKRAADIASRWDAAPPGAEPSPRPAPETEPKGVPVHNPAPPKGTDGKAPKKGR